MQVAEDQCSSYFGFPGVQQGLFSSPGAPSASPWPQMYTLPSLVTTSTLLFSTDFAHPANNVTHYTEDLNFSWEPDLTVHFDIYTS